ncbi:hypothetical protein M7784_01410 [Desulfovibrio aminophilus]|nr:hypothetical protein [Desulfovibrio aminophilus]MCM0753905.1 hypothetical protein [Desulfovibrio aminophilus]
MELETGRAGGTAACFHPRVSRGSVVIFEVKSDEALQDLPARRADIVPTRFGLFPLVDEDAARRPLDD